MLWGTVLADDYSNSGAISTLSQTFDLTGVSDASLSWLNFVEVFYSFDTAELKVNGDLLYERTTNVATPDWELQTVDLTPYVGGNATIQFELFATTVVDRGGWYIDDVEIVGQQDVVPEPTSLFGFASIFALAFVRRKQRC